LCIFNVECAAEEWCDQVSCKKFRGRNFIRGVQVSYLIFGIWNGCYSLVLWNIANFDCSSCLYYSFVFPPWEVKCNCLYMPHGRHRYDDSMACRWRLCVALYPHIDVYPYKFRMQNHIWIMLMCIFYLHLSFLEQKIWHWYSWIPQKTAFKLVESTF
jgi:hypothetical protein